MAQSDGLADATPNTIADHRTPHSFSYCDAEARYLTLIRGREEHQERVRPGPFGGTHPLEVGVASKTIFAFHTPGPAEPAHGLDDGQPLATAKTSTSQDVSPARAAHALEEAVLALSRHALRLIGSFRHAKLPSATVRRRSRRLLALVL
jgi:hypothetical protein